MSFRSSLSLAAIMLLACVGCGSRVQMHPVSGVVLLADGRPLAGAVVSFLSADGKLSARGVADHAGRFAMGTFRTGDGVPAGSYRAVVHPPASVDADKPPEFVLAAKYSQYESSGLEFTVGPGRNDFTIHVD